MPRVSIAGTDKIFDVKDGEIIYDALCDRGEELPHGCLAGSCGACRIHVIEGAENLAPATYIESNTLDAIKEEFTEKYGKDFLIDKHLRLACRARVKGDVQIKTIK
jgi:ferredoxin